MTAPQFLGPAAAMWLAETFAHFLWEGAAIVLILALAWPALRHASASARYRVLVLALLLTAAAPIVTFSLLSADFRSAARVNAQGSGPIATHARTRMSPELVAPGGATARPLVPVAPPTASGPVSGYERYSALLLVAYAVGVVTMLARLAWSLSAAQRLRRRSQPVDDPALLAALRRRASALNLRFTPALLWCGQIAVPAVVGVIRPAILLPVAIAFELSPQQVEAILAHELAHLRRWDHVVLVLQRLIEAFLFFHPAVWVLSRRIDIERENCCDDLAVARIGEPSRYAEALLRIAELACGKSQAGLALRVTGQHSHLRRRIDRLLRRPGVDRFCLTGRGLAALAAVVCSIGISAASLKGRVAGTPGPPPATSTRPATLPTTERGTTSRLETERGKLRLIQQLLKVESNLLKEEKADLAEERLHAPYAPGEIARVDPVARQKLETVSMLQIRRQEGEHEFGSKNPWVLRIEQSLKLSEADLAAYTRKFNEDFAIRWAPDRTTGTLVPLREPSELEQRVHDLQRLLSAQARIVKQLENKLPAQAFEGKSVPELKAVELRIAELRRRSIELLAEEAEIEQLLAQRRSRPDISN